MNKMKAKVIGLAGGIGAGKSMVLDIIKSKYDCLLIDADKVGHMLQMPGCNSYRAIVETFGDKVLKEPSIVGKDEIDRRKLGDMVFSDISKLNMLNQIMHPAIHNYILETVRASEKSMIVIEAALLTETSLIELVDEVWYVYCHQDIRIERLIKHRGYTREKAINIISNQPSEDVFKAKSQVVIDNSGTIENTEKQVNEALDKIYMQEEHYG